MADRDLLAQQIGSWLTRPTDQRELAQPLKLALAETFPVQSLDLRALRSGASDGIIKSDGIDLHLIRDELGTAVSYARSRAANGSPLLSVSNASPLPSLLDQGLDRLSEVTRKGGAIAIILNPSISLAALRLVKEDTELFCLIRLEGCSLDTPLKVIGRNELFAAALTVLNEHHLRADADKPS